MNILKGFGTFIMRGNVVDLAVAVVIGAAFNAVVGSLVKDIITPFLTALIGKPDYSSLTFTVNNSIFRYGEFLNSLISFVLVAGAIYFFVITPMNAIVTRIGPKKEGEAAPALMLCPECQSEIPTIARRCKYCTSVLPLTTA